MPFRSIPVDRDSTCPQPFDRVLRSGGVIAATLLAAAIGAVAPVAALTQGPNYPSTVVNETGDPPPHPPEDAWQNPQNAAASDDVYTAFGPASKVGPSQLLKATGFGFSIPGGAIIQGIEVTVEGNSIFLPPSGQVTDVDARIVKNGTNGATNRAGTGVTTPGTPDEFVTYGGSNDLWGETWSAADINAADFGFAYRVSVITSIVFVDAISIRVFYSTDCGNNMLDAGEQCDDGNTAQGDCCSSTCLFDSAGTPCPDATVCNGAETCDGVGACQSGTPLDCDDGSLCTQDSCHPISGCMNDGIPPAVGCRSALKSVLIVKDNTADDKDKLAWSWVKGQSTMQADFGIPTSTTDYSLCIYAGVSDALVAHYRVPANAMSWAAIGTKGYKYRDSAASSDGIIKVLLKGGTQNAAKCLVKGKGDNLDDFDLTELVDPVTVQLVNDGTSACFESTFDQTDFIKFDDPAQFRAKAQ